MGRRSGCSRDPDSPLAVGNSGSMTVALTRALRFGDLEKPASFLLRLRAIRRRRLAARLSGVTAAVSWIGVVTFLMMIGGGLLNTR